MVYNDLRIVQDWKSGGIMDVKWITDATSANDSNIFVEKYDDTKYAEFSNGYFALTGQEKGKYKGMEDYISKVYNITLNQHQKNYKKFNDEIEKSFSDGNFYSILPVSVYSEKETIMDLLTSLENENYIKKIYKIKKKCVTGELKTDTASKLMDSIRQGRSLLESAKTANMLSKPLIDFYAASAYAYATIVINSPLHKVLDTLKGSHGHTYNHKDGTVEFGGKTPSGTFIDLLFSIYTAQVITGKDNFRYSLMPSLLFIQSHEIKISLIALLSTVPELNNQVLRIPASQRMVYPLNIKTAVEKGKAIYTFEIGDGIDKPSDDSLKLIFGTEKIEEKHGKSVITIPAEKLSGIMPTIYHDIHGNLWYINQLVEGFHLPEICLHFLIISALCNIMRYSPYEWNNILSNKISSDFSLLISKYLRLFELKYPMLVVRQLTEFLPTIKSE